MANWHLGKMQRLQTNKTYNGKPRSIHWVLVVIITIANDLGWESAYELKLSC
jgi:hypothetical protein